LKELIRLLIRHTPLRHRLMPWLRRRRYASELRRWQRGGRLPPAPQLMKEAVLKEYARELHLKTFVETGTYLGDMTAAMRASCDRLYSIELSEELFREARRRFLSDRSVTILQGDSGVKLADVMARIDRPTLFWLDGHYSGGITARGKTDTPILEELEHILAAPCLGHVIVIDDARCFGNEPGYPTIDELKAFVLSRRPHLSITVRDDSVHITPSVPKC
jgi:hypothetical protein